MKANVPSTLETDRGEDRKGLYKMTSHWEGRGEWDRSLRARQHAQLGRALRDQQGKKHRMALAITAAGRCRSQAGNLSIWMREHGPHPGG